MPTASLCCTTNWLRNATYGVSIYTYTEGEEPIMDDMGLLVEEVGIHSF
jgi:hypothetical protein